MTKPRRSAIAAAVLATVFAAPAVQAQADKPDMPEGACAAFLGGGGGEKDCGVSLRFWADVYAGEQETHINNNQQGKPLPSARELSFIGDIRAQCEAVRAQGDTTPLTDTVLAADKCLRKAFEYGRIGKTNTFGIEEVGVTLQKVGRKLESQSAAIVPMGAACGEYLVNGDQQVACRDAIVAGTLAIAEAVATHAGDAGESLRAGCGILRDSSARMRIGYVANMAINCLAAAEELAQETGYEDIDSIVNAMDVVGQVGLSSIGTPQPKGP